MNYGKMVVITFSSRTSKLVINSEGSKIALKPIFTTGMVDKYKFPVEFLNSQHPSGCSELHTLLRLNVVKKTHIDT